MPVCFICQRLSDIKNQRNPYLVRELRTGFVVVGDFQLFRGYTIFLNKHHVSELHELPTEEKELFLREMAWVAQAVYQAFKPSKLNYELLGNTDRHLHWHLIPRYLTDQDPKMPIWTLGKEALTNEANRPTPIELAELKKVLARELDRVLPETYV